MAIIINSRSNMKRTIIIVLALMPLLFSCKKEEVFKLVATPSRVEIYSDETKKITTNAPSATLKVADDFYASIEDNNTVKAQKVGETTVIVSANGQVTRVPLIIKPRQTLYPDLDKIMGKTKSDVVALLGSNYSNGNAGGCIYTDYNTYVKGIVVSFDSGKATAIGVAISSIHMNKIVEYLLERYSYLGLHDDFFLHLNHDKDVAIGLTVYSADALMVIYAPMSDSKSAEATIRDHASSLIKSLEQLN